MPLHIEVFTTLNAKLIHTDPEEQGIWSVEDLAEALLDFSTEEILLNWLQQISEGTVSQ